jgi:Uroporphyrinogen decarboxylase (URO-D)
MTGRERVAAAMRLERPDRVPVMCQLAIGHYFLNTDVPNEDIWFDAEGFAKALVTVAREYGMDGILINLLPAAPDWRESIDRVEEEEHGTRILHWKQGGTSRIPANDNLHHFPEYQPPSLGDVQLDRLFYDDPHGLGGMKHPFYFGFDADSFDPANIFPDYLLETPKIVRKMVGDEMSVHAELFSPFTQLMELFGYTNGLMNLMTNEAECHEILKRYAVGTAQLACKFAALDIDAMLISSAFAGAGFISREFYQKFVHPYEKQVVDGIKAIRPDLPVYVHTCGSIGDRLELMLESGYNGVDTLDPPPLGNVELADAVERLSGKAFIKGNMDAVNTLLNGTLEEVIADATKRIQTAGPQGGYILSSACSVAPHVEPEKLKALVDVAEKHGRF